MTINKTAEGGKLTIALEGRLEITGFVDILTIEE